MHDDDQSEYNRNDDYSPSVNQQYSSILIQKLQFNNQNVPDIFIKCTEEEYDQK